MKLDRRQTYGLLGALLCIGALGVLYGVVRVTTQSWCLRLGAAFDTGSIAFDFDRGFWRYCAGRKQDGSFVVVPFEAIRRNDGWQQAYGWWEQPEPKTPSVNDDPRTRDPLDEVIDRALRGSANPQDVGANHVLEEVDRKTTSSAATPHEVVTLTPKPPRVPAVERHGLQSASKNNGRPRNGEVIYRSPGSEGLGKLTVANGNERDAVVSLVSKDPAGQRYMSMYVHARGTATLPRVPDGVYVVDFILGDQWNGRIFLRDPAAFEFADPFLFERRVRDTRDGMVSSASAWKVTLHAVVAGNAKTRQIAVKPLRDE